MFHELNTSTNPHKKDLRKVQIIIQNPFTRMLFPILSKSIFAHQFFLVRTKSANINNDWDPNQLSTMLEFQA